jgi:hypothetical protein
VTCPAEPDCHQLKWGPRNEHSVICCSDLLLPLCFFSCCPSIAVKSFDLSSAYHSRWSDKFPGKLSRTDPRQVTPSEPLPSARQSPKYPQSSSNSLFAFTFMSHTQSAAASSSNFQLIISNALDTYRKRTKKDLLTHPLAARLQACDTPAAILTILREQIHGLDQSQISAERWSKWLDPTVNVLFVFSATIGAGAGLVCLRICTHPRSAFSYSFGRYFLPRV